MSPKKTIRKLSLLLPRLGLSSLLVCVASGLVLTFYYRPVGDVFRNVEEITTLVPYGMFFRQLHYGSGELFVILMLIHTVDHFLKGRYRIYPPKEWGHLILSLCLCLFALFTGFVLKGDKKGFFAGQIFINILKALPLGGEHAAKMFMEPGKDSYFLPYLYHCFFLPLMIIYLIRGHIREWLPHRKFLLAGVIGLFSYALLVKPHLDVPPDAPVAAVHGPWFFLGIQSLLKTLPPLLAGILAPTLFLGLVFILPLVRGRWQGVIRYAIISSFSLYGAITIRAILIGP